MRVIIRILQKKVILSLLVYSLILLSSCYGSDSLKIRVLVLCNLDSPFYNCSINDFKKIIDTSFAPERKVEQEIEILIKGFSIQFKTAKATLTCNIINNNADTIWLESKVRKMSTAISLCNREAQPYCIIMNLKLKQITMFYDRSELWRKNMKVFEGKVINYCF